MKSRLSKQIALSLVAIQVIAFLFLQIGSVTSQSQRALKILDNVTGRNSISLGNESEPIPAGGLPFTIKIMLAGATIDVASWQVAITFDNNSVRCTSILVPENDPPYIFYGKPQVSAKELNDDVQNGKWGRAPHVVVGAALIYPDQAASITTSAVLCVMNFTALRINNLTLSFLGADDYSNTFLADSNAVPLPLISNQPYTTETFSVNVVGAVSKPVAVFKVAPENPQSNQTVVFDASSSYDAGGGTIKSYIWDFGDNTTVADNKSTAVHAYLRNGLYPVNLTIMNDNNLTGSTVVWLQVGSMPTANFTYSPIGVILPTDELTFNASKSTARNSTIVSYFWDFGDNSTITLNESIVNHRYSKRGVYNVNLTVEDNFGLLNWSSVEIQVGKPPNPLFTWTPESPQVGDEVAFTSSATADTGVSIANYAWDFGERLGAVPTNESVILHSYATDGNWTVTLTVYDSDGLYSSYDRNLEVFGSEIVKKPPDYTLQIIFGVILAIIIVGLVVRRLRTKKEEALDI